jgi:hypothetical protein
MRCDLRSLGVGIPALILAVNIEHFLDRDPLGRPAAVLRDHHWPVKNSPTEADTAKGLRASMDAQWFV